MEIIACKKVPIFDQIKEKLYLGDIEAAKDKACLENIDVIINLSNSRYEEYKNKEYFHFDLEDSKTVKISHLFEKINNIIEKSINDNKSVLIHCMNAVSRSVTFLLYHLMKKGFSLADALDFIKSKRQNQYTRPNIGFFRQLLEIEKNIFNKNSMSLGDYQNNVNLKK
jgi:atypical dual specificity phosphatase